MLLLVVLRIGSLETRQQTEPTSSLSGGRIMRASSLLALSTPAVLLALAAAPARANDGTPPEIFEMIQQGQDVTVTFGIFDPFGEPDIDQEFDLIRSGPEGEVLVIDAQVFDPAEGEIRDRHCHNHDFGDPETFCQENPADCEDCDGDSVAECPTVSPSLIGCAGYLTFEAVDECVPPGETTYILQTPDNDSQYMRGEGSLTVADSGEACQADVGDDTVSGCSVSGIAGGADAVPIGISALMGLLGLTFLRRGRSR
jgi:hypothetical protein